MNGGKNILKRWFRSAVQVTHHFKLLALVHPGDGSVSADPFFEKFSAV
jgi:hypothetical protein